MDFLPDTETLSLWLLNYGSLALFVLLALGIIALPVPEETLMVVAGILMKEGKLVVIPTMIAIYAGSMCGITVSYLLGRSAGRHVLVKYGSWVGVTHARLDKAHGWFERYGKWTLPIGYFVPGMRHFTGFSAGTTQLGMRQFILFAYAGAICWVSTFLSMGYYFGDYWIAWYEKLEVGLEGAVLIGLVILTAYLFYLYHRKSKK